MSGIVELRVPAVPEYLQMVRSVVGAAASIGVNLKPERVSDLRLAVSEAATNAMEAHGLSGVEDRVVIRCDLSASQIEVEVADSGPGFDPNSLSPLPDVDSPDRLRYESGLGVSLMHHLTDETIVESHGNGTAVRLIVHFGN